MAEHPDRVDVVLPLMPVRNRAMRHGYVLEYARVDKWSSRLALMKADSGDEVV